MDTFDCIKTKLHIREFVSDNVSPEIKSKVLEAARMTGIGLKRKHWRFMLVENKDKRENFAEDSTSGSWVVSCDFAIIILTKPTDGFHLSDAGRILQNIQFAAWHYGVGSGIFTGIKQDKLRNDFGILQQSNVSAIIGFGYPQRNLTGNRKKRLPIHELVYYEKYGIRNTA